MGCVYQVRNKVNGKQYIGRTTKTMKCRKATHQQDAKGGSDLYFHRALRKYGFGAFEWKVLFDNIGEEDLDSVEVMMIRMKRTKAPNGYNMTDGGEGNAGWHPSKETIEKLRKSHLGKHLSLQARLKVSKFNKGKTVSAETGSKISIVKKQHWESEDYRNKTISTMKRNRQDPQYKERRKKMMKEKWKDPEYRARMIAVQNSPEVKAKRSKSMTEAWARRKAHEETGDVEKMKGRE